MTFIPTKQITKTQQSADLIRFGHIWLFRNVDITKEYWTKMMFEYGVRYAEIFSGMFDAKSADVEEGLLQGDIFWNWWRYKWMNDDFQYVSQKMYRQPLTYEHYKTYLICNEQLQDELIQLLKVNNFHNNKKA